jgi:hypothetical protein
MSLRVQRFGCSICDNAKTTREWWVPKKKSGSGLVSAWHCQDQQRGWVSQLGNTVNFPQRSSGNCRANYHRKSPRNAANTCRTRILEDALPGKACKEHLVSSPSKIKISQKYRIIVDWLHRKETTGSEKHLYDETTGQRPCFWTHLWKPIGASFFDRYREVPWNLFYPLLLSKPFGRFEQYKDFNEWDEKGWPLVKTQNRK